MLECRYCDRPLGWATEYCPFCGKAQPIAAAAGPPSAPAPETAPIPALPKPVDRTARRLEEEPAARIDPGVAPVIPEPKRPLNARPVGAASRREDPAPRPDPVGPPQPAPDGNQAALPKVAAPRRLLTRWLPAGRPWSSFRLSAKRFALEVEALAGPGPLRRYVDRLKPRPPVSLWLQRQSRPAGRPRDASAAWPWLRSAALVTGLILLVLVMYHYMPDTTKPKPTPVTVQTPTPDSASPKHKSVGYDAREPATSEGAERLPPLTPTMVPIPAGRFSMGCQEGEQGCDDDEKPAHWVQVPAFELGKYEVTFDEWDACVADGGCTHKPGDRDWGRGRRPVIDVSWDDAQHYVTWLSRKTAKPYRLPSEAEWEYAARAGTQTPWSFGDDEKATGDYAWFGGNAGPGTHPVGEKRPNPWGLYDMHGNVWEWVQDNWHNGYQGAPMDGRPWEEATSAGRVLRGGSWLNGALSLRSAYRHRDAPGARYHGYGFRLALGPEPRPEKAGR